MPGDKYYVMSNIIVLYMPGDKYYVMSNISTVYIAKYFPCQKMLALYVLLPS